MSYLHSMGMLQTLLYKWLGFSDVFSFFCTVLQGHSDFSGNTFNTKRNRNSIGRKECLHSEELVNNLGPQLAEIARGMINTHHLQCSLGTLGSNKITTAPR